MHEMSIALEIRRLSRAAIVRESPARPISGRGPGGRLERVRVIVGELSAVEPDLLAHAWEALTAGSRDEGSRLEIEWRPARQFCAACDAPKTRGAGSWLRICPDCGMPLRVEGGTELDLKEIEFSAEDEMRPRSAGGGPDR